MLKIGICKYSYIKFKEGNLEASGIKFNRLPDLYVNLIEADGFSIGGQWSSGHKVGYPIDYSDNEIFTRSGIYAFSIDEIVFYMGRTIQPINKIFNMIKKPGDAQWTHQRNHEHILKNLISKKNTQIHIFNTNNEVEAKGILKRYFEEFDVPLRYERNPR